jgi:hypothetical protein
VTETLILKKEDGHLPELAVDGRTTPRAPNLKHLRYSRKLPMVCNDCPYRPKSEGGSIGLCISYEKDSVCKIRADTRKIIEKYSVSNSSQILPLLEEEFEANFEKLKFFEAIETMTNKLDPEVTKRQNALAGLGKLISDMKTKKNTMTITETKTITEDQKTEIARMISLSQETKDDTQKTTAY